MRVKVPADLVEKVKRIAQRREAIHKDHTSSRPLSDGYEFKGLLGEAAFALEFHCDVDWRDLSGGDGGIDFKTSIGTIDIKTAVKAYNLLMEINKQHSDILVLARFESESVIFFCGWEREPVMKTMPSRDFGYGIVNYYRPVKKLRAMASLKKAMGLLMPWEQG